MEMERLGTSFKGACLGINVYWVCSEIEIRIYCLLVMGVNLVKVFVVFSCVQFEI